MIRIQDDCKVLNHIGKCVGCVESVRITHRDRGFASFTYSIRVPEEFIATSPLMLVKLNDVTIQEAPQHIERNVKL